MVAVLPNLSRSQPKIKEGGPPCLKGLARTLQVTTSLVHIHDHEVWREQGVLTISDILCTVREVGRKKGVLTISVVFSTAYEVYI